MCKSFYDVIHLCTEVDYSWLTQFLLATYGIWGMREVLVSCREKLKKIIADFHVLGLFMAKKHDLSDKKISVCHAPLPLNAKFVPRLQPRP
jgi:hypothetical protein